MPQSAGRPIDDDAPPNEPMALLSRIAGRAMEAGADPPAVVSPDHELLVLCDSAIMQGRRCEETEAALRASCPADRKERDHTEAEHGRAMRAFRRSLLQITKLRAVTPAGIFAKALAVEKVGTIAATALGRSLASDLVASAELREAIWPADTSR